MLDALAPRLPTLIGGSADLTPSNNTRPKDAVDVKPGDFAGRYIRFGIREHAMGAMLTGMAVHGGVYPYGGTFLVFSDYMRGAVRVGDHEGARDLRLDARQRRRGRGWADAPAGGAHGRAAGDPGVVVIRPADANETAAAWKIALQTDDAPVGLMLTRLYLPTIDREKYAPASSIARGAYVLDDASGVGGLPT